MLYTTELSEFKTANPMPQLKIYMLDTKGQPRP